MSRSYSMSPSFLLPLPWIRFTVIGTCRPHTRARARTHAHTHTHTYTHTHTHTFHAKTLRSLHGGAPAQFRAGSRAERGVRGWLCCLCVCVCVRACVRVDMQDIFSRTPTPRRG